jgi:hypothetical protein
MDRWERKLATRDTNRQMRPFQWGLEWLGASPNGDPRRHLEKLVSQALAASDEFYAYRTPSDFELRGDRLNFTSPLATPHPENNTVHARFFPCPGDRAVVVMPQWNASADGHVGLCKLLNRFGISALRMSLAYHDARMPAELERADYHMSSNLGRTIHACQQSVIDARACLDWLESRGYRRLAVLGTSLGSCIAFIAAAHDSRVKVQVCNHVSNWVGDVVWTGLSTRHVRQGFGDAVTQDDLRRFWSVISPASYFDRIVGRDLRTLLVWTSYDTTFLPEFSREVVRSFETRRLPFEVLNLPCGHYTLGQFPFNWLDGLTMCRFLQKNL